MKKFNYEIIKEFISKPLFDEKIILNKNTLWPKISIVTPSYNQAEFLERTIFSVLNQNYPNLEYIIIDGGSTDGSLEIIKNYEKYLTYWVHEKDNGQADAINKGFKMARGEIFAWLNSDDTYVPGALFKVAKAFKINPKADLVFGNIYFIDEYDNKIGELRFTKFDFSTLIFEGGNLHQTGTFWTKHIYEQVGGVNPNYKFCMDYDFFCRVAKIGILMRINDHLASFRNHKNTKSSTINHIGLIEHEEIMNRYIPENTNMLNFKCKKTICTLKRFSNYLIQGDVSYVLRSAARRIVTVFGD